MDIVKDINEILKLQDTHEKRSQIEDLSDVFEYCSDLSEKDVAEGVQILLAAALQEEDEVLQESLFNAISPAVAGWDIENRIDWDRLAASLPSLRIGVLFYVFNMLGISGQARYLPALEKFTHHTNPEIRESAQEAISELKHQLALTTKAQKAS